MKQILYVAAFAAVIHATSASAQVTGRQLDVIAAPVGATTLPSSNDPTEIFQVRPVIGIFWDDRCTQVSYTLNSSVPVNAGNGDTISTQDAAATIQTGLDRWNDNPSSYIEMNVDNVSQLGSRPRIGGDFVNEIVFTVPEGFGNSFATSVSTPLLQDTTFVAGEDFDGDGDSDVYDPVKEGLNVCKDIDNDGDIEFPAGDYKAGTILDNDVQFRGDLVYSLESSDSSEIDLDSLAVHEFGHSHGLNHSMINQISSRDASGSTMYPFLDNTDGAVESETRSLHVDDLAASAFLYPEGKNTTPNTRLQPGDVAFSSAYTVLTGNVTEANGRPVLSAAVSVLNSRGERLTQTYSGANSSALFQNAAGTPLAFSESVSARSGSYALPVPVYNNLTVEIEALDGFPLATGNIGTAARIAGFVSNTSFPEEKSDLFESANETFGDVFKSFFSIANLTPPEFNFTVNQESLLSNANRIDFSFNSAIAGAQDLLYVEVFNRDSVLDALARGDVFTGATFTTPTLFGNRSKISDFNSARLALGRVDEESGNINVVSIVDADDDFVAQEAERSPYNLSNPVAASINLASSLATNPDLQVLLMIEANNLVPNRNNIPNALIAESRVGAGTSFLSINGGPIAPVPFGGTYAIQLRSTNYANSFIPGLLNALGQAR